MSSRGGITRLRYDVGSMDAGPGCLRGVIVYLHEDGQWVVSGKGGNGSRHSTSYVRYKIGITKPNSNDVEVRWTVWEEVCGPHSCAVFDIANDGTRGEITTYFNDLKSGIRKLHSNLYRKKVS